MFSMSLVFVTLKANAKAAKKSFEENGQYDKDRKMAKFSEEEIMIPIKQELAGQIKCLQAQGLEGRIQYSHVQNPRHHKVSPQEKLKMAVHVLLQKKCVEFDELLHKDLPSHWEQHGDMIVLPEKSFTLDKWQQFGAELWEVVSEGLHVTRIAKKSRISDDGFRTPKVILLYGDNGWVTHVDNGIKYTFDVTKCMFSAGNITEKIRIGHFDCKGQTIVDLYAGIGYFVLPYLIHTKAAMVYACEWDGSAVEALKKNLHLNGVEKKCVIYEGDNQKFPLQGVADRVNLGLIPSSEAGWHVACAALRSDTGGWLHIHGNVTSGIISKEKGVAALCGEMKIVPSCNKKLKSEWLDWAQYVGECLLQHLKMSHGHKDWDVLIQHIEHVKSYAPHIDHVVLDVECHPVQIPVC